MKHVLAIVMTATGIAAHGTALNPSATVPHNGQFTGGGVITEVHPTPRFGPGTWVVTQDGATYREPSQVAAVVEADELLSSNPTTPVSIAYLRGM